MTTQPSPFSPIIEWCRACVKVATPLGWSVLAATVIACVVGAVLGWAEFLAVAAVGALALLIAIPFVLASPTYEATLELASDRVTVGESAVGRVIVKNLASRVSPSARIELPVGNARAEFRVPRLPPEDEHDDLFAIPTHRRAVITLGPITSVRSDPLILLTRSARWSDPIDLYIHPKVVVLDADTTGIIRDLEGLPTRDLADDDVSFHALREYVPGDDLRHVHWRSSARTGMLMIRQFEQTRRSHLVIVLSTRIDDYSTESEFELAISMAGSLGLAAIREGKTVSILNSIEHLTCPTPTALLDRLSAIEEAGAQEGRAFVDLAHLVTVHAPQASVTVFITGSRANELDLRTSSLRVPTTVRSFGLRANEPGELSRKTVGEFVYIDVPELDTLARAMRAVSA